MFGGPLGAIFGGTTCRGLPSAAYPAPDYLTLMGNMYFPRLLNLLRGTTA